MPYSVMGPSTNAKLSLIAKKAKEHHTLMFTSLIHLLNDEEYLYRCFQELEAGKAAGVDARTKESYTEPEIRQAITDVARRLKTRNYRPQPVRRVCIPKSDGKQRPLGIPTVMDKMIQLAVVKILTPIFEPVFLNSSYGYRPNRNAHGALKAVHEMVMGQKVNWIVDADIQSFFDTVNHDWLMKCLNQRICDPNFLALIRRMLTAGVITEGIHIDTERGTPQGGIISPILANIYLHYVLDLWFAKKLKPIPRGYAGVVRYADDFVIGCQYQEDADTIVQSIKDRFEAFGLTLAKDKTRVIEFGRFAKDRRKERKKGKPETFTFLGFTHYCAITRKGTYLIKLKTSKQKHQASVRRMKEWLKAVRNQKPLPDIWRLIIVKLRGHYQYYGVSGNYRKIRSFQEQTERLAFKWLNRRSQKRSWNWEQFHRYLDRYPLPKPTIVYDIYAPSL